MKRMLEDELIDYLKKLGIKIIFNKNGTIFIETNDLIIRSGNLALYDGSTLSDNNDHIIVDGESGDVSAATLTASALSENTNYCGAIFNAIDSTLFETHSAIHASNLGTIARGFFKIATGKSVTAGTNIYQTDGQALHDAILAGDESAMPYTHLLCKVKGGSIFWLSMTADGSNKVMLSPNIDLAAGSDCYVIAAVQSSNIDAA